MAAVAHRPQYSFDEILIGIGVGLALHIAVIAPFIYKKLHPSAPVVDEAPLVAKPVIAATLLKLGKPIDPKKLPDRIVPRERTAPKKDLIASREDPAHVRDAGAPPPPNTRNSDIAMLAAKSDPFAEDAGKPRPEEGNAAGIDGGTETDPNKVRAGDMYAALLNKFFHDRWQYPSIISQGEANRLCVVYRINLTPRMVVWHLKEDPMRQSGNTLFDDSAHEMLQKLLDDRTPLPDPPPEVAEMYRGRTLDIVLPGDPHGDSSRCK